MHISFQDWIVIAVYLFGVVGLGCWAGLNAKRKGAAHGESAAGDYFMAAHTLKCPVIGMAHFATINLCSASNSIATRVSYDVVKRFRPAKSDPQLVLFGRFATVASIGLGIALVPLLDQYESIFNSLNDIIAHMAPPITSVFVLGVFWPAASAHGAKWTMWLGSLMGAVVFGLKTLHTWQPVAFGWVPPFFTQTAFMLMAFYLFVTCVVMHVAFTLAVSKVASEDVQKLYWPRPLDGLRSPGWPGLGNYKLLAAIVFLAMGALYIVFR